MDWALEWNAHIEFALVEVGQNFHYHGLRYLIEWPLPPRRQTRGPKRPPALRD